MVSARASAAAPPVKSDFFAALARARAARDLDVKERDRDRRLKRHVARCADDRCRYEGCPKAAAFVERTKLSDNAARDRSNRSRFPKLPGAGAPKPPKKTAADKLKARLRAAFDGASGARESGSDRKRAVWDERATRPRR